MINIWPPVIAGSTPIFSTYVVLQGKKQYIHRKYIHDFLLDIKIRYLTDLYTDIRTEDLFCCYSNKCLVLFVYSLRCGLCECIFLTKKKLNNFLIIFSVRQSHCILESSHNYVTLMCSTYKVYAYKSINSYLILRVISR